MTGTAVVEESIEHLDVGLDIICELLRVDWDPCEQRADWWMRCSSCRLLVAAVCDEHRAQFALFSERASRHFKLACTGCRQSVPCPDWALLYEFIPLGGGC